MIHGRKSTRGVPQHLTDEQRGEIALLYRGMCNCTWSKRELAERKTKGGKRHIVVDVLGCLLSAAVHAANIHGTKGEISTAKRAYKQYPPLQKFCANAGYRGTFVSDLLVTGIEIVLAAPVVCQVGIPLPAHQPSVLGEGLSVSCHTPAGQLRPPLPGTVRTLCGRSAAIITSIGSSLPV